MNHIVWTSLAYNKIVKQILTNVLKGFTVKSIKEDKKNELNLELIKCTGHEKDANNSMFISLNN